jgi:hypothetical protein
VAIMLIKSAQAVAVLLGGLCARGLAVSPKPAACHAHETSRVQNFKASTAEYLKNIAHGTPISPHRRCVTDYPLMDF